MPRAAESKVTRILGFFKDAPLGEAEIVYGLVGDQMRERRRNAAEAEKQVFGSAPAKPAKKAVARKPRAKRTTTAERLEKLSTPPVNEASQVTQ